jgi:hypothetical protein
MSHPYRPNTDKVGEILDERAHGLRLEDYRKLHGLADCYAVAARDYRDSHFDEMIYRLETRMHQADPDDRAWAWNREVYDYILGHLTDRRP